MKRIAINTAGGDAPGMNACLRAVVRSAIYYGLEVVGFEEGYWGLIKDKKRRMDLRSVSGIISWGGTVLKTKRCEQMKTKKGIQKAGEVLKRNRIDGLITIGGDGSFKGGMELYRASRIPIVGIPASIDNDIPGTEDTIGFDTAVNTALESIQKIRDTASSHDRIFIIEVMGRERGFIALAVGLASGAEIILVPEVRYNLSKISQELEQGRKTGKKSSIIVMAEGAGAAYAIAHQIRDVTGYEVRVSVVGYIQRGGSPTARSVNLANLFGHQAVKTLMRARSARMVGWEKGEVVVHPLDYVTRQKKEIDRNLYRLAHILAI
ncbi:ATP-dependent 6-phosphofructokinase [bacterium]|nr:ATP-dependent 6-phosphofructokinase [bacterium]NIN91967.1 ATP-dependent 6-phosphofructokinase [bacterium]NIO18183.1 ATP-dependent 6-phosphofructokinase [bacterium]NIO73157.1 ATP-dependent 6-phosphofructokinase [bacterium]